MYHNFLILTAPSINQLQYSISAVSHNNETQLNATIYRGQFHKRPPVMKTELLACPARTYSFTVRHNFAKTGGIHRI